MPSLAGASTLRAFSGPVFASGSSATSGESSVQQNDPKSDKRISVGWHWTYGWLRRPEMDETYGYAYEDPEGDLVFVEGPEAKKSLMLECREDTETGERYLCLYIDQ